MGWRASRCYRGSRCDSSVIFTVALVGSNIALWRVTRTAANAAKQAAESLLIVERAYVYPIIFGHGALKECIQSALVFYLDDPTKDDVPVPETAEITFKFKNFGKPPAILKNAFVAFGVPPHGALMGVSIPKSVLASLEETGTLTSQMQIGITKNQARHILAYTGHICFEGNVTFDDIWGNEHKRDFISSGTKRLRAWPCAALKQRQNRGASSPQRETFWAG
jgi:hypothetical protein